MSPRKRISIILFCIIGVPIVFYALGAIVGSFYPHAGSEWGIALGWIGPGFLSMLASCIAGPIVSYTTRNRSVKPWVSLLGYTTPPLIAFILGIVFSIMGFAGA